MYVCMYVWCVCLDGCTGRLEDLIKIMGLRGLQRQECRHLVEAYNRAAPVEERINASFQEDTPSLSKLFAKLGN